MEDCTSNYKEPFTDLSSQKKGMLPGYSYTCIAYNFVLQLPDGLVRIHSVRIPVTWSVTFFSELSTLKEWEDINSRSLSTWRRVTWERSKIKCIFRKKLDHMTIYMTNIQIMPNPAATLSCTEHFSVFQRIVLVEFWHKFIRWTETWHDNVAGCVNRQLFIVLTSL